jgi:nicotinamidase-related amidase
MKALLIIDMLNDFVNVNAPLEVPVTRKIVPKIQNAIKQAVAEDSRIIFINDCHESNDPEFKRMGWPPHAIRNSHGAKVIDALGGIGDKVIEKTTYSGFFKTELEYYLIRENIEELYIAGCVTNICILYTVADAVQRGYRVTVLKDCVAGINEHDHKWALQQMQNILGAKVIP